MCVHVGRRARRGRSDHNGGRGGDGGDGRGEATGAVVEEATVRRRRKRRGGLVRGSTWARAHAAVVRAALRAAAHGHARAGGLAHDGARSGGVGGACLLDPQRASQPPG
eukprot:3786147-Prymnesium_polylepis.1